jgi:hypothetical protein
MPEAYGRAPRRTGPEPGYAILGLVCVVVGRGMVARLFRALPIAEK